MIAAQKRKVIITGDPAWESTPKPDFIASLVFGGPIEQIFCGGNSAAVTFINPEDAQAFFDATPNGVVYRKTSEAHHYAEIRMAEDVSPASSLVTQYVGVGATRCVKATGVDVAMSLEYLTALGNGRLTSRGTTPRTLERLVDDMNPSGVSTLSQAYGNTLTHASVPSRHVPLLRYPLGRPIQSGSVSFGGLGRGELPVCR